MASSEVVALNEKVEAPHLCRVCGSGSGYHIPIFNGDGLEHDLASKINKYLPIQVFETDKFPLNICWQCASSLISWHQLVVDCLKADEMFHNEFANKLNDTQMENEALGSEAELEENSSKSVEATSDSTAPNVIKDNGELELEAGTQESEAIVKSNEGDKSFLHGATFLEDYEKVGVGEFNSSNSIDYYTIFVETDENGPEYYLCKDKEVEDKIKFSENESCTVINVHVPVDCDNSVLSKEEVGHNTIISENGKSPQCVIVKSNEVSVLSQVPPNKGQQKYIWKCVHKFGKLINNFRSKRVPFNKMVSCTYCQKMFRNQSVLITHTRIHTGSTPFYCKFCGKSFYLSSGLKQHLLHCNKLEKSIMSKHSSGNINNNNFVCSICNKMFKLKSSLKEHLKKHAGKPRRKLKCDICGNKFHRKVEIMEHLKSHSGVSLLTCETCGKSFINIKDLQNHQISHTTERPYKCLKCGATYKRKSHLSRHLLKQNGNKLCKPHSIRNPGQTFTCEICGKVSATRSLMLLHKISHTGERKYQCHLCDKRFAQSAAMSRHVHTVHNGAKDFSCEVCGRKFTAKSTKLNHMSIHTGEKPFQCTTCGKTFRTQQQSRIHEKIHSDIRPYACVYCPKTFRRRPHLVVHIRTHTGEKPYACPLCNRAFAQKNDMTKHLSVHNK